MFRHRCPDDSWRNRLQEECGRIPARPVDLCPAPGGAGFDPGDVVYVLDGSLHSLEAKFRTASKLVRAGTAARVLVRSSKELLAFSPALGRNQTVNEWVAGELDALGVATMPRRYRPRCSTGRCPGVQSSTGANCKPFLPSTSLVAATGRP